MTWAYIAGYFDGEGHVALRPEARGVYTHRLHWFNTHHNSLQLMRDFLACGIVREKKLGPNALGRLRQYELVISRRDDLLRVLPEMIPHLIVKHERAIALLDYTTNHVSEVRSHSYQALRDVSDDVLRVMHHEQAMTLTTIAKRLGVTCSSISLAFRTRGIDIKPRGWSTKGVPKSEITRQKMRDARRLRETRRQAVL